MNSADVKPQDWMKTAFLTLLLVGVYYSAFQRLLVKDWGREDYSYGYLIPAIALYLFWEKRKAFQSTAAQASWAGLILLIPGIVLFWTGELSGEYFSLYISSWLVLVGICWMLLGWNKLKTIGFALIILLSMFPPPHFISDRITLKLKMISSKIGVAMLHAYGMSAFREGNVIDLGFTQLQVVDACSGLRYLFPLIIMSLLLAYFYKASLWKKIVLVLSAIPLTILTNSLRIAMTGILYQSWGPAVAEGFFHGFSGWFIFMFALAILLLEMWGLSKIGGKGYKAKGERGKTDGEGGALGLFGTSKWDDIEKNDPNDFKENNDSNVLNSSNAHNVNNAYIKQIKPTGPIKPAADNGWQAFFRPPQFIVAVLLLGATLALSQGVEFREKIPMSRSFTEFPLQVGEWSGKRDVLEQKFIDELDFKDYIIVNYVNDTGKLVNFYTAYYDTQRKGESIHSPETCLPGGGWEFRKAGRTTVAMNPSDMTINRAFIVQGAAKQLTYYWFPLRDRIATNLWEVKAYNFWDALTRQRTDGALVRLVTPVYKDEEVADADKRLVAFTREIVPVLNEYLPK